MSGRDLTGHDTVVNYLEDFVGADIPRDLVRVAIADEESVTLTITTSDGDEIISKVVGSDGNRIADIPLGTVPADGDEALLTKIADALQEVGNTQLRVDLENYNGSTIPVEQQTAVKVEDSGGTTLDLLASDDVNVITTSESNPDTYTSLVLGDYRKSVDIWVNTSGEATMTVQVRKAGGPWRTLDEVSYNAETTEVEQYDTSYEEIRAKVDTNLNGIEMVSKGV